MEKILVAGATGTTGKQIVNLLEASQYFKPIAMVRKKEQIEQFSKRNISTLLADLEEDVSKVTKDIDKVIFAAGSKGKKVEEVDKNGAKKLVDASETNNIKKFVMLSSLGADTPNEADELQDYLKAKQEADNYLEQSKLTYSIIRPGHLTNDKATHKVKLKEKINEMGEISRADVAQILVSSLHDNALINSTVEVIKGDTLISKAIPNELD